MIMADVFTVLLVILGFWLLFPACCLMARSLAPARVEAARDHMVAHPYGSFAWGLVVWLPSLLAIVLLSKGPGPLKLAAAFGLAGLMAHTFLGLAGLATHIGQGLESPLDADRPWLATLRGMVCLQIPATLPFLGWFVVAPTAFLLGAGAAWRTRKGEARVPEVVSSSAETSVATDGAPA